MRVLLSLPNSSRLLIVRRLTGNLCIFRNLLDHFQMLHSARHGGDEEVWSLACKKSNKVEHVLANSRVRELQRGGTSVRLVMFDIDPIFPIDDGPASFDHPIDETLVRVLRPCQFMLDPRI